MSTLVITAREDLEMAHQTRALLSERRADQQDASRAQ